MITIIIIASLLILSALLIVMRLLQTVISTFILPGYVGQIAQNCIIFATDDFKVKLITVPDSLKLLADDEYARFAANRSWWLKCGTAKAEKLLFQTVFYNSVAKSLAMSQQRSK